MRRLLLILAFSAVSAHAQSIQVVDTAVELIVNSVPLSGDGTTIDETIAYNEAGMELYWSCDLDDGTVTVTAVTPTTAGDYDWTHVDGGIYKMELPASGGVSANNTEEGTCWWSGVTDGILIFSSPKYIFTSATMAASLNGTGTDFDALATASALTTAQNDLDIITGAAGVVVDTGGIAAGDFAANAITDAAVANDVQVDVVTIETNDASQMLGTIAYGTAQSGGVSSIQLAAAETFGDNELNNTGICIVAGTGAGRCQRINGYTGATDTATVVYNWATQPDATSAYRVADWALLAGMADNVIGSGQIVDGGITDADVADDVQVDVVTIETVDATNQLDTAVASIVTTVNALQSLQKGVEWTNYLVYLEDSNGSAATGLTDIVCTTSEDAAARGAIADTTETEIGNGVYALTIAAGENNGNTVEVRCTSATAGGDPFIDFVYPQQ